MKERLTVSCLKANTDHSGSFLAFEWFKIFITMFRSLIDMHSISRSNSLDTSAMCVCYFSKGHMHYVMFSICYVIKTSLPFSLSDETCTDLPKFSFRWLIFQLLRLFTFNFIDENNGFIVQKRVQRTGTLMRIHCVAD